MPDIETSTSPSTPTDEPAPAPEPPLSTARRVLYAVLVVAGCLMGIWLATIAWGDVADAVELAAHGSAVQAPVVGVEHHGRSTTSYVEVDGVRVPLDDGLFSPHRGVVLVAVERRDGIPVAAVGVRAYTSFWYVNPVPRFIGVSVFAVLTAFGLAWGVGFIAEIVIALAVGICALARRALHSSPRGGPQAIREEGAREGRARKPLPPGSGKRRHEVVPDVTAPLSPSGR